MTLIVRRPDTSTGGASPHARAEGPDAQQIRLQLLEALRGIRQEGHRAAQYELIEILASRGEAGWDGEDADAVSVAAYIHARSFLESMPATFPTPEVSVDPDGEIAFDWIFNRTRMFSISFGVASQLAYSGLIDGSSTFGTESPMCRVWKTPPSRIQAKSCLSCAAFRRAGMARSQRTSCHPSA